jgi:hypothetical protein
MVPPTHAHGAIAFLQAPVVAAAGDLVGRFPQGSQLVRLDLGAAGGAQGAVVVLTPEFFAAADPQISFDGNWILFSGKLQRDSHWQIWQMPAVGGAPLLITDCEGDCLKAVYLPSDEIAYTTVQGVGAERESGVEVCAGDGADAHAITFGPGRYEVETVLHSGRLLLSAEGPPVAHGGVGRARRLYVVDPDGSGLMMLRENDGAGEIRGGAEELADGTIVFLQRDAARGGSAELAWIRPGALRAAAIERGALGYASVRALSDGMLVVSRRGVLYSVDLKRGGREALLYRDARGSSVQAVPIAAHAAVEAYRSILHPERKTGRILCLDSYASEDVASGRLARHVARVRVLAKAKNGEKVLGGAPVEVDGSFYATVPADRAIRLELIGNRGEVVKAQRSWMWVRGGEDRGCTGCHENQALAPENRSPMTLQRFDTPSALDGAVGKAARP